MKLLSTRVLCQSEPSGRQNLVWAKFLSQSWYPGVMAETKISANASCVTPMGELIKMVQYMY